MSASSSENRGRCPACGAEIPPEAPEGLCPRCVLAGVAEDAAAETVEATRTAAQHHGMQPPSLDEIAAAFPQFEILELIGSGGMGAVFKVRQPKLDRVVALKVLPRELASDERFTERFTREARALAMLNHPNIVAVHDFGESGGFHYLLMEFVDGANLREAMQAGRFTPEQAFAVVPEICAALQYAHDEGVLHRDIKPENLLLDTKGRVKIVDFGIAKLVGPEVAAGAPLTGTLMPGTPQYMAPEQIEHPTTVDHRADIYSLGVVFYEMLTGELPIGRFAAPSEKARVGGEVDDIVFRTLEKEPADRQQSAGEVKTQVEGIGDAPPPPHRPATPAEGGPTANSRRAGRAFLLLAAGIVVFLVTWGALLLFVEQARHAENREKVTMEAEMTALQAEAAQLEQQARTAKREGRPAAEVSGFEAQAEQTMARMFAMQEEYRNVRQPAMAKIATLVIFIAVCVVCGVAALLATIRGWQVLRDLRLSGEHRGRVSALITTLTVPVAALSALIFAILVAPARGSWTGPAISLAIIGILIANAWLILRTWRWLNTPPAAGELAEVRRRQEAHRETPGQPARRGVGWVIGLVLIFLLVPVLMMGGCVALYFVRSTSAEYDRSEKDRASAAPGEIGNGKTMSPTQPVPSDRAPGLPPEPAPSTEPDQAR